MSLNRYRLRHRAKQGHRGAIRTARLLERPERLISLILLGNNFVNILASAIATVIALRVMGQAGIAVATENLSNPAHGKNRLHRLSGLPTTDDVGLPARGRHQLDERTHS